MKVNREVSCCLFFSIPLPVNNFVLQTDGIKQEPPDEMASPVSSKNNNNNNNNNNDKNCEEVSDIDEDEDDEETDDLEERRNKEDIEHDEEEIGECVDVSSAVSKPSRLQLQRC
jgi:hypothetical protein